MPQVTRRDLHDLDWSMPMKDAAASVSMSSGGLTRICHRHSVPIPPRSYWSALRAGRTFPKVRVAQFIKWAEPYIASLKEACGVDGTDRRLKGVDLS